jgi:DMSO/TMAO reductase YedYZ heme-binding membrane subunit
MATDFNSPKEIVRRLAFLAYVLIYLTYLFSCVIALARPGLGEAVVAVSSLAALVTIRYLGYRYLDFKRLSDSFPSGCALDLVPEPVRDEVETLVREFHAEGTDWQRRVEIRHRLVELEEEEPAIIHAYEQELKQVLAA